MRISDWISDVCSSYLSPAKRRGACSLLIRPEPAIICYLAGEVAATCSAFSARRGGLAAKARAGCGTRGGLACTLVRELGTSATSRAVAGGTVTEGRAFAAGRTIPEGWLVAKCGPVAAAFVAAAAFFKIGRTSWRERGCKYV